MKAQSRFSSRCGVFDKHASLVTKITTLFTWFRILSLTAESMASFTPADLFLCHLNTNLLHLKCAMIPGYLAAR